MPLSDGLQFSFEMNEASGNRIDSVSSLELAPTGQVSLIGGYFGNAVDIADGSRLVGTAYNSAYRGAGSFTVACWVNLDVINLGSAYPMIRWNGGGTARDYNLAVSTAGAARFEVTTTTASVNAVTPIGTITTGTWFLLIGWYDATVGANGTAYIQVNNGPVFSTELTGPRENVDTSTVLSIGQGNYGFTPFGRTDGKIDKVRKWSRVLTAIERVELWSGTLGFKTRSSSTFAKRYTYQPPKAKVFEGVRVRDHDYASLRQGLVGAWCPSLPNGGSGNILPDQSGRGNNGTLTNMGPEDWVASGSGRALDFDGVNDVVEANRIDLVSTGTLSAWVKLSAAGSIIIKQSKVADQWDYALYCGTAAGITRLYFYGDSLSPTNIITSPTQLSSDWTHVIGMKTATQILLFVNGFQVASASATNNFQQRDFKVYLGYDFRDVTVRGAVQIDDARIYNRALTEAEIRLLASKRGIGLQPSPTRFIAKEKKTGLRRLLLTGQT